MEPDQDQKKSEKQQTNEEINEDLFNKSAELKKRNAELNAQIAETMSEAEKILKHESRKGSKEGDH